MVILYSIILVILTFYSYALIDPNITFVNSPVWSKFLENMLQLGYYHRDLSFAIYLVLIILLFVFFFYFQKKYQDYNPFKIALIIGVIILLAYPFLSHDLFNYLFDAKILTVYHKNPYLYKALDFPNDQWIRFMHWTHRSYPYGPVFLGITIIPSFLAFGKFLLSFVFYKLTVIIFYVLSVFMLSKINKKAAILFATQPLIIIEGLVNGHNDMIALSLVIIGFYYLTKNNQILSRVMMILSGGIKYLTLPLLFLSKNKTLQNWLVLILQILLLVYLSQTGEIQPWYFLALFAFIPFYESIMSNINIFIFGLLLSYYPYIRLGGWDTTEKVFLKHQIIIVFLLINMAVYLVKNYQKILLYVKRQH